MRLEKLHVEGFGHFHRRTIGPLDRNVTVLYGPNEAGKSTLLAFVRAILFGFPSRGRNQHYPPLAGGRHGGRIQLQDDAGARFTLERYAGTRGGPFVLRNAAGQELPDSAVLQRLTGHASADLFRNIFAFSLDEIQSEGLMHNAEVSDRIYSAGMGGSKLPEFTESLSKRKNELFRPRGSAQKIARLLRALADADKQLGTVQSNADQYRRLAGRQEAIAQALEQAETERAALQARAGEVQSLLTGWDDGQALRRCEAQLQTMPQFARLPENPIERLENLEERLQQAREDQAEAAQQLQQSAAAAAAVVPGERLLHDRERIEDIRRARGSFDGSVRDLPERQGELREMEDALAARLRELGDTWHEDNLDDIDTSLTVRNEIEEWGKQLSQARQAAADSGIRLEQDKDQEARIAAETDEIRHSLQADVYRSAEITLRPPPGGWKELMVDREPLERLRQGRQGFGASVRDLPKRQAELKAQEAQLNAKLRDFGPGWDESRLDSFDTSIVFRQEVERWKARLGTHDEAVRQAQQRWELEKTIQVESEEAVRTAEAKLPREAPSLDAEQLDDRRNALRRARSRLDELERARINVANLQSQLQSLGSAREPRQPDAQRSASALPGLLILAGIGLMLASLFLPQGTEVTDVLLGIGGLMLLLVAGAWLLRSRALPAGPGHSMTEALARNLETAAETVDQAERELAAVAAPLDLQGLPTAAVLDEVEAHLEKAGAALATWTEAQTRLAEARQAWQTRRPDVDTATRQQQTAAATLGQSRQEWRSWLQRLGIDEGFSPDTMMEFAGALETGRTMLDQVRQMRHRVRAIEVDIEQYRALVHPLAVKYDVTLHDDDPARIMAVTDAFIEQSEHVGTLVTQYDGAKRRLQQQSHRVEAAERQQAQAADTLDQRQAAWKDWLGRRGLHDSFTPTLTLEFLARAESVRTARAEVRRMRDRVAAIEHDIHEFQEQVQQLALDHAMPPVSSEKQRLAAAADELINKFDHVQSRVSDREQARERQVTHQNQWDQRNRRLESLQESLTTLLAEGDTDDVEEFRRRARQQKERLEQERQRNELLEALRRLSGPHRPFDAFRNELAASERSSLEHEAQELTAQLASIKTRDNELREERGRNENALEQLTSEEESSRLRIRRNILREQLQERAREWSQLRLAEMLLDQTRQKFERERQPSVIRHAKGFFADVTGRRYTGLFAPIGERSITVTDVHGIGKKPSELSRGTREQLYLALRFGLILEFGEHAERLPVVVDEALVNFDADRARAASAALTKLADTNQVLVFTCHRNMAEMFAADGALVLDIGRSGNPA